MTLPEALQGIQNLIKATSDGGEPRQMLELTEAATRLADRSADSVTDELWEEAGDHYDERQLAAIILTIATNMFNRVNTTITEPAGTTWGN
jgi:alkylhydroperoxidase family enzyme